MEKIDFLNYLNEIGLTPNSWWNNRSNITLFLGSNDSKYTKDIEKLIKLYGKKPTLLSQIEKLNSDILKETRKEFTVQEIILTQAGEGYGEQVVIILHIPEFKYILKSSGPYYSYEGTVNFSDWEIVDGSNHEIKVQYA